MRNGKTKTVMHDVTTYEQTQNRLALLKILTLGNQQIADGKVVLAAEAIRKLRRRVSRR
jgi:hypothetical protein